MHCMQVVRAAWVMGLRWEVAKTVEFHVCPKCKQQLGLDMEYLKEGSIPGWVSDFWTEKEKR